MTITNRARDARPFDPARHLTNYREVPDPKGGPPIRQRALQRMRGPHLALAFLREDPNVGEWVFLTTTKTMEAVQ